MKLFRKLFASSTLLLALATIAFGQVNITTWQVDLKHSGNNAAETILTPGNVGSPGNFGLLFAQTMDGQTYGQPLLASGVNVAGTLHNIVYAATEHGSIYAFDADNNTGTNSAPLWKLALLPAGTVPVPQSVVGSGDIPVELGITTTPVIDRASSTIYIVSKVQRTSDTTYHQYLYALDLATGATKFGSPVEINPTFAGTSSDSSGGVIPFNALREHLRSAMFLHNGIIYLAYASHSDSDPYHGEIIGYNATTLLLAKTFISTPNSTKAGIWQSGASPAVDSDGNIFVAFGNGAFNQTNPTYPNWGESILKIPTSGALSVAFANTLNWFTPNNWATLNNGDLDLGSGGITLLPDQAGPHQHIMVGGGKGAVLYVVDRDNLGGLHVPDNAIQEIPQDGGHWLFVTPAYYNGFIYYSASGGPLEQHAVGYNPVDGSYISTTPTISAETFGNKGSGVFISSNGTTNGIAWILTGSGIKAYNATNVSTSPIFAANATIPGNITCQTTKFSLPMVANGKVYYAAYNNTNVGHLLVYGLLPTAVGSPAAPSNATASAVSSKAIAIGWTSNSNNESGFKIKRSTSATGTFTQIGTSGAGVTTYTDSGLNPLATYYYQVLATNANGDSNASNVIGATTFPSYTENGLVAYWNLDETGGTSVADATTNAHTGTINGEAGLVDGLINNGVELHGTGQATSSVSFPNKADLQFAASGSFTLSTWVFPSALRSSDEAIFAKSRDQGNYYGIWINASNRWVFRGPSGDVVGPVAVESAWTHVAVVQDGPGNSRKIYINGILAATGAAQAADGAGVLWLGQQNVSGNFASFPGIIDEVRLYNRALSAAEISNLMGPAIQEAHLSQTQGNAEYGATIWPATTQKIEPRKGSPTGKYKVVLNFSAPVSGISASLQRQDGAAAVGTAGGVSYDATGRIATLTLTGVGNAQPLLLHLAGILPGPGTMDIPFNILWGDVNGDNVVYSLDLSIVQNSHSSLVSSANSLYDINCDGIIDSTDDALVTAGIGTSLGAQTDTNLAFFQTATALSVNGTNLAKLAVDANALSRWESTQGVDPQWIYINLGGTCTIHSVVLNWENAAGKTYTIDVSDNTTAWTTIQSVPNNTGGGIKTYPNLTGTGSYVRMNGTARTSIYGYSLYDFQVIGVSGTGALNAPTINSATTVFAAQGNSLAYQITATNSPSGFNATSLPPGMTFNSNTGTISGIPNQSGTFNTAISATNSGGTGNATVVFTVQSPFATWQNLSFTAAELSDPNISGANATPAGDGISNLMKYALNLDPETNGTAGLPSESMTQLSGKSYLTLNFTKVIAATDISYTVEVSSDLQTWHSGSAYTFTTSVTNNPDGKTQTVTVRDLTATSDATFRYIRLKINQPPLVP